MEKSWETLSDLVIHAGGSWALGRFGCLFQVGRTVWRKVRVYFLCSWSFIHFVIILPTPFSKKNSKVLACKTICLGMFHCGRMKNGGANIVLTNEVRSRWRIRGQRTGH